MDKNKLLTPIVLKLMNDDELYNIPVIKGPRKPEGISECITVNAPSAPMDPDTTAYNGTILINYYCPNYKSGNANLEKMGPITERIVELMHDNLLNVDGYRNYNFAVDEPMGPLWDSDEPEEHFMSIRIKFGLIKN